MNFNGTLATELPFGFQESARDGVGCERKTTRRWIAHFLGKPGQMNLSRLEGIGKDSSLAADRADGGEAMHLLFHRDEEMPRARLKALLAEHAKGFQKLFGE